LALQFSKTYIQEIDLKVNYKNIDIQKVVQPNSDKNITLQLEGSGLQLLKFSFIDNTIDVDSNDAQSLNKKISFLTGKKLEKVLDKAIKYKGKINSISKDTLYIRYDLLSEKEVAIKIKSDLEFQPGYQSLKGVELDSIKVKLIGPSKILSSIESVSTEEITLTSLSEDYKGVLNIYDKDLPEEVSLSFKEIGFSIAVEKLTEGVFKIPVKLVNANKGGLIQIFPKEVNVIFKVALKEFPSIKSSDFEVQANFDNRRNNALLPLKITKSPHKAFDVRLNQNEVQFILIK